MKEQTKDQSVECPPPFDPKISIWLNICKTLEVSGVCPIESVVWQSCGALGCVCMALIV